MNTNDEVEQCDTNINSKDSPKKAIDKKVNPIKEDLKRTSGGGSTTKSKSSGSSTSFYAQNAKTMYEMIKELKQQAGECGKNDDIKKMLEELAPTTLLISNVHYWPPRYAWSVIDAMDASFASSLEGCQRLRISNENCYKKFTSGRRGGVEGYPIFSTYSEKQRGHMKKINKKVGIDDEAIKSDLYRFLFDSVLNYKLYSNVRNQLWAYYMGFCEFDILTRLWNDDKINLKKQFYQDDKMREYAVKCYLNELRVIDDWSFDKDPVDFFGNEDKSLRCIQQILRGHATAIFILVSQPKVKRIPTPVEFVFGKFRFPTHGLKDGKSAEGFTDINDLGLISLCVEYGLLSINGLQNVMFDYIGKRIKSYVDGELISQCRFSGDVLVYEYLGEAKSGPDFEISEKVYKFYLDQFKPGTDKYGVWVDLAWCYSPHKIAREVGIENFFQQAKRLQKLDRPKTIKEIIKMNLEKDKMTTAEV